MIAGAVQARSFISPMGEPFRDAADGKAPADVWFAGADKDDDGRITRAEFLSDAGRFFQVLDSNHDNEIGPEEIERYESDVAPEVRTSGSGDIGVDRGQGRHGGRGGGGRHHGGGGGARGGGADDGSAAGSGEGGAPKPAYDAVPQGAARFGYLDLPEPVIAADTDFNRGVSVREWLAAAQQRFALLDANHDGAITRDDLPHLRAGTAWSSRRK